MPRSASGNQDLWDDPPSTSQQFMVQKKRIHDDFLMTFPYGYGGYGSFDPRFIPFFHIKIADDFDPSGCGGSHPSEV
jgi:hypothetical protein